ncbi:MAG: YaiI/YqxD family protein [Acidobacteriota bacterium]|nr:YaiI/YqxD family protein [Acidobacteriota bacterium]
MLDIYVDADGCPVKPEVYKVARRYRLNVILVANSWMRHPPADWLTMQVVEEQFDGADDWIVEHATDGDIVIASDIPLADRCLKKGARVLGHRGRPFTQDSIGDALATRELMSHLREMGSVVVGQAPFNQRDRSRFLQGLDQIVQAVKREV